jgi:hypothetical protein
MGATRIVDADGCELTAGVTTWEPWRWGGAGMLSPKARAARDSCRLHSGVIMRDPETREYLPRYHELPFEADPKEGAQ